MREAGHEPAFFRYQTGRPYFRPTPAFTSGAEARRTSFHAPTVSPRPSPASNRYAGAANLNRAGKALLRSLSRCPVSGKTDTGFVVRVDTAKDQLASIGQVLVSAHAVGGNTGLDDAP